MHDVPFKIHFTSFTVNSKALENWEFRQIMEFYDNNKPAKFHITIIINKKIIWVYLALLTPGMYNTEY